MATLPAFVYEGILQADGTIHLDRPPEVRPGRVRIALHAISVAETCDPFLPDPPWPDESISAPCDLPLPGPFERVQLVEVCSPIVEAHDVFPDVDEEAE